MATTVLKLAEPVAAKPGAAMTAIASATVAMRAKLLMRVIWDSPLGSVLEPVTEVQADQVCVSVIRPVEIDFLLAQTLGAAFLEVERELGGVEYPRAAMPADAERRAFAIRVGKERTDVFSRLRRPVVQQAETDVPGLVDGAVRAETVGVAVIPVLMARNAGGRSRDEVDLQV